MKCPGSGRARKLQDPPWIAKQNLDEFRISGWCRIKRPVGPLDSFPVLAELFEAGKRLGGLSGSGSGFRFRDGGG
jgi:hypothetical protein